MGNTTRIAKLHLEPCPAWGTAARIGSAAWEVPLMAQVGGIRLDDEVLSVVVATLASSERPVAMDRARLDRQKRDLALGHAAGDLSDEAYLGRMSELRSQTAGLERAADRELGASRAVAWLRAFAEAWQHADVPEAKAELIHAIYERVVVAGRRFVEVRLTPAAYKHGLALALPDACYGAPGGIRTPDTRFRRPMLWSTELRARGPGMIPGARVVRWTLVRRQPVRR